MRVVRHSSPESFRQVAFPYLLQEEATHNLILGMVSRYVDGFPEGAYFSHVEDVSGDVVAVAMTTPPNGAVLATVADEAAITLLVQDYADVYETLPSVLGSPEDAKLFAELWSRRSEQPYTLYMQQGIYKLETVIPVENVSGEYRVGTANERELVLEWMLAFAKEALNEDLDREKTLIVLDDKLKNELTNCVRLWWDDGKPVSMIGSTRPTLNGCGMTWVYTPPELRGQGYASALTAAICQELLDSGRKFCFLYTDMSNPTSNKIYQNIGYKLVCHQHSYHFSKPM